MSKRLRIIYKTMLFQLNDWIYSRIYRDNKALQYNAIKVFEV